MPPPPPSATTSARLWEKWSQIVLTGTFIGGFAWWWGATHGSQESKPEGVSRKDPLSERPATHPPRPPAEAASVKLAKAAGYVDAGVESGEEPVQGVFKDKKG